MKIIIADTLKHLRSQSGISQEILAEYMGVSVQAVSKWENSLSCPDISLLPLLADYFGVSVDYLLTGNDYVKPKYDLPDDGKLRIVQAKGNKLLSIKEYDSQLIIRLSFPEITEQTVSLDIWGSCSADGDISGNIQCGSSVSCANVGGNISCGDGVNCSNVGGDIFCGDGVNCGNVGGCIQCGDSVNCGNVSGSIQCGDSINCGDITGKGAEISVGGDLECGNIYGNVTKCEGDISCKSIHGAVNCNGSINYTK
mgnify:CR=1 FL=1